MLELCTITKIASGYRRRPRPLETKKKLVQAADATTAALKVEQENHLLTCRSLKAEAKSVKRLQANLEKWLAPMASIGSAEG